MEGLELICFNIISCVGSAKSSYIEAIRQVKEGKIEEAKATIEQGRQTFVEGHRAHAELIHREANNEKIEPSLLLIHAEDQLMSAESFGIIAEEFISIYERLILLEKKI
jgi:PTS system cellobiose-specific IIA component